MLRGAVQGFMIQCGEDLFVDRKLIREVSLFQAEDYLDYFPLCCRSLRILLVIGSYPGDFFGCMLLMTAWTSVLLKWFELVGFSRIWMSSSVSLGVLRGGFGKLALGD
jgi:hypothetical protein